MPSRHKTNVTGIVPFGILSDKFGRKTIAVPFTVLTGAFGVASAMVTNYEAFLVLRFLSAFVKIGQCRWK